MALAANHGKSGEKTCLHNPLIGEQLVMGHIAREVLGIRRLMDETRGVISLRRLVTDIRGRWKLFTRENCVCHDGLPYDYEAVMREEMTARAGKGAFWGATTGRRPGAPRKWRMSSSTVLPASIRANARGKTVCLRACRHDRSLARRERRGCDRRL